MKKDLITSITAFIIGIIVAYFVCGFIIPEIASTTIPTAGASITGAISEPDPEIFNYRAINPTSDIYVNPTTETYTVQENGDVVICVEYDNAGDCVRTEIIPTEKSEEGEQSEKENSPQPEEPEDGQAD